MLRIPSARVLALLLLEMCETLTSGAQNLTPERQQMCARYSENLRCQELVNEFLTLQALQKGGTPTLDNPPGDTCSIRKQGNGEGDRQTRTNSAPDGFPPAQPTIKLVGRLPLLVLQT